MLDVPGTDLGLQIAGIGFSLLIVALVLLLVGFLVHLWS
jgi:hypothetical protein